jgi:uncharacterized protein with LGFP repeats
MADDMSDEVTDDMNTPHGRFNVFDRGGMILWQQDTWEAYAVYGGIQETYKAWLREFGHLGFPASDEEPLGDFGDRIQYFEGGWIEWHRYNGETSVWIYPGH